MRGTAKECITYLLDQDQEKAFEVKESRARRSLTANSYYWVLLNKLAGKMRLSDSEVHRWMLRDYGQADVFSVKAEVPVEQYFKYFDVIGTGELNGTAYRHVRAYKGSSKMDSQEFSRLLDGMRYECEQQGIEVMTPQEIAALEYVEAYGEE